jgi:hypothetical protein
MSSAAVPSPVPPLEAKEITNDGGLRKVVVRQGTGGLPPLHSRCLGTLYRKIELLSSCLLAETPLAFRGLTKNAQGQLGAAAAGFLRPCRSGCIHFTAIDRGLLVETTHERSMPLCRAVCKRRQQQGRREYQPKSECFQPDGHARALLVQISVSSYKHECEFTLATTKE